MTVNNPAADTNDFPELVDISPSPRILQVLGDIEFEQWQCVAELADNSFDEFLEIMRAGLAWDEFIVTVVLPSRENPDTIEVRDTGRGMTLENIRDAVRAGWTGNDQFDKLGLFGMGFNIATARLGGKATVLTKRAGADEWVGVEIDLRAIAHRGDFKAPVVTEPADDPGEHGTRVIVSNLKPEYTDWFQRNGGKLRTKLGDVYSHLLEHEDFKLYIAGQPVQPRKPCIWDASRTVTRRRYGQQDEIPAVIEIDRRLPDQAACSECRHWQDPDLDRCEVCGSPDVAVRERRIHGWIGIQRYLSPSDFGIDFVRNGRKILMRDRRLFEWEDPNSDTGSQKEYPIELPANEGRIVGEIHVDHVPVNYQKNAFEYHGREWRTVLHTIRGEGPMRDGLRKEFGYTAANNSPLARLYDGFRRNDPGLNYLTPGNGTSAIHEKARDWATRFRKRDPELQSDEKWFEAAERHDELKRQAQLQGVGAGDAESDEGDILGELGLTGDGSATEPDTTDAGGERPPKAESEQERQERLRSGATEMSDLSAEYSLPSVGTLKIAAYLVSGARVTDAEGNHTPVYLSPRPRSQGYYAFIDAQHPVFRAFGSDYADFLLFEIAHHLKTRASSALPLGELVGQLKERHLRDLRIEPQVLAGQARSTLREICERMAGAVDAAAAAIWDELTDDQRNAIETSMIKADPSATADAARTSGEYLRHLPALLVPQLVQARPELWLDGRVFKVSYAQIAPANEEARQVAISRLAAYLLDIALLADAGGGRAASEMLRARHTLNLLSELLAPAPTPAAA